jgi:hypothetical protein
VRISPPRRCRGGFRVTWAPQGSPLADSGHPQCVLHQGMLLVSRHIPRRGRKPLLPLRPLLLSQLLGGRLTFRRNPPPLVEGGAAPEWKGSRLRVPLRRPPNPQAPHLLRDRPRVLSSTRRTPSWVRSSSALLPTFVQGGQGLSLPGLPQEGRTSLCVSPHSHPRHRLSRLCLLPRQELPTRLRITPHGMPDGVGEVGLGTLPGQVRQWGPVGVLDGVLLLARPLPSSQLVSLGIRALWFPSLRRPQKQKRLLWVPPHRLHTVLSRPLRVSLRGLV